MDSKAQEVHCSLAGASLCVLYLVLSLCKPCSKNTKQNWGWSPNCVNIIQRCGNAGLQHLICCREEEKNGPQDLQGLGFTRDAALLPVVEASLPWVAFWSIGLLCLGCWCCCCPFLWQSQTKQSELYLGFLTYQSIITGGKKKCVGGAAPHR